jgi:hypothetical protein
MDKINHGGYLFSAYCYEDMGLESRTTNPRKQGLSRADLIIFHLFFAFGKTGGLQIRRCQGLAVAKLGALALKPSGFFEGLTPFILEIDQR